MKLCITEKPSVARDIAEILGANGRNDGFFEGNGYNVTWTYGHLCTLKEPADYTPMWKRWSLSSLPMIPQRFGIKLIDQESIKRQFKVIESLIAQADEVINCGDAGQEGELIQRWVMQKAKTGCEVKRLWISSLTDDAIREGFRNLRPQIDFDNLYYAGLSRAVGDWILGMNATRLYTLKYSEPGKVLSVGRVQTPTLALVVQRQLEIDNFKPEDYWEIKTVYRDAVFNATAGRYKSEAQAEAAMKAIEGETLHITDVQEKKGKEAPPRLFDLTSLQVECNKRWGWSAEESLRLIQSLYEKKVTTYPRVDTTYLSDDIYAKVPEILKKMTPYEALIRPVFARKLPKSKRVFDSSKVTDHHAIIPTGQLPNMLDGNEKKMYHLIARRFIGVFYPDCVFSTTNVMADVASHGFKASGKTIIEPGWRVLWMSSADDRKEADGEGLLPQFVVGESGPHSPSLVKKVTQPPKLYTEGSLLRAMETAGRTVDDEALREAMKENGIGRPSTRANIIETLFKRGYMVRSGKSIKATSAGIELISTIHEELLKSAKLTGIWENKLRRIERGEYSAKEFIDELKTLIDGIVLNVLQDNSQHRIVVAESPVQSMSDKLKNSSSSAKPRVAKPRKPAVKKLEQIACPVCGSGHIVKGHTAYGCSRFKEGCRLLIPFSELAADLTPGKVNSHITKKYGQRK